MRAVHVREFGAPEVLRVEEAEQPSPSADQVLVAVELAGVLFGETIVRRGGHPFPLPYVAGMEVGGQVVAVGPAADPELLGRRVVGTTATLSGGYAEFAVVGDVYVVPDGLPLDQAVAVFGAGGVAAGLLAASDVRPSDTVLITAAAGRIGSMLVQLAKAAGARVVGAVGGAGKFAAAAGFGADLTVDYLEEGWADRVGGASLVLDAVGGAIGAQAITAAADGGRIGVYGYASGTWTALDAGEIARRGLTVSGPLGKVLAKPKEEQRADVRHALQAASAGELVARIHAIYPLDRAAEAHTDLEQRRNIGAVLLDVTPPRERP
jgi:NADPH2:quinone reductase